MIYEYGWPNIRIFLGNCPVTTLGKGVWTVFTVINIPFFFLRAIFAFQFSPPRRYHFINLKQFVTTAHATMHLFLN